MAYGLVQLRALITQKADVKKRNYAFQRQLDEKPRIIPGCPGARVTTAYVCSYHCAVGCV